LVDEVVDADPEVDDELGTLEVVAARDVVVGLVEPPEEHAAMTRAAPPMTIVAAFRRPVDARDRSAGRSCTGNAPGFLEDGLVPECPCFTGFTGPFGNLVRHRFQRSPR
jgi:hypothetical protein